jgi:hypothetical protein
MRDERTVLTLAAADLVVARWSLFDGQRTGHARGLYDGRMTTRLTA